MGFEPERLRSRLAGATSERLVLREPSSGDAIGLFEATRHPQFNQHLMWDAPAALEAAQARLERLRARVAAGACAAASAIDRASGRWAAIFRFEPRTEAATWAEVGLWSHPDFWGAGHGEELTRLALDRAWLDDALEMVVACVRPAHRASLRLLERCGLEPAGVEWRAHENGQRLPLLRMAMTRTRWRVLRADPSLAVASVSR